MTSTDIKRLFKLFNKQDDFTRMEIKTDIAEGKGVNGVHYVSYYHGTKSCGSNDYYKYDVELEEELMDEYVLSDNYLIFRYTTRHINKPDRCYESFYPQTERVFLDIKHITGIVFDCRK